jgi:hypothetical protein
MSRPHASCETIFNSLYVALPVNPCLAVQKFLDTFPAASGRPMTPGNLHVSVVYGDEFAYPMLGPDEYRALDSARTNVTDAISNLMIEGAVASRKTPQLEPLGNSFWGISLPATEEFKAARKAAGEAIADTLGVKLISEVEEMHVSMIRRRKTRGCRQDTVAPAFYRSHAEFTVAEGSQVDIVTTSIAAVERAQNRRTAQTLRKAG